MTGEVKVQWSEDEMMYNYNGQHNLCKCDEEVNIVVDYEYNKEF